MLDYKLLITFSLFSCQRYREAAKKALPSKAQKWQQSKTYISRPPNKKFLDSFLTISEANYALIDDFLH